MVLVILKIF